MQRKLEEQGDSQLSSLGCTLLGACRDMNPEEINERGSRGQNKRWKAILSRELREIGVIQLSKENAEEALQKLAYMGGLTRLWWKTRVTASRHKRLKA